MNTGLRKQRSEYESEAFSYFHYSKNPMYQTMFCLSGHYYSSARCCRHLQIFAYITAFILGFLVFIPIGQIVKEYKIMGCILFANVSYVLSGQC